MTTIHTDVVVIGVGAMGSATLWRLAERGVACVGFERFEPGHDRGSSHGDTRIFRTAYMEGASYVPLAQQSIFLWRELQRESGDPVINQNGAITLGRQQGAGVTGTIESIRSHQLPHRLLDTEAVRAEYPVHRMAPGEVAIYEQNAGYLRPEIAIRSAVRRAEHLGARVLRNAMVEQITQSDSGVRISAGNITCTARHVVVSVGAWLPRLLPDLTLPLRVTRQVLGWFPIERPELFAPDKFPVFLRDITEDDMPSVHGMGDSTFYGFPTLDGQTIKVGIHREGAVADPDHLDRSVSPDDLAPIQLYIERFLHGVGTQVAKSQVCMYTNTPDHNFLIGSPADMPRLTLLGGFSGHGFKFAPVVGEAGADLATIGSTDLPVQWLTPNRFVI